VDDPVRAGAIREMFDRIAPGYDLRNTVFSLGRDRAWRRRAARLAGLVPGDHALDLCTGSGRLAGELLRYVRPGGRVTGIDFSEPMLERARKRQSELEFVLGDVTSLPYPDGSINAVTIAFGLRNLVNRRAALNEMFRVLSPGGRLVILEFPTPGASGLSRLFRFYLTRVMPAAARLMGRQVAPSYQYLSASILDFPSPTELSTQLRSVGFSPVSVERPSFGIVAIHVAVHPDKITAERAHPADV
jgi:demethylmenaquinone methyltransferase/2-methoxy-6-polyprenyl-1,4-benzoquinol methylase